MIYDVLIIGGGPAGITAGIYSARKKMKTALLCQKIGGEQLSSTSYIENYPPFKRIESGKHLVEMFYENLKIYPVDIIEGNEIVKIEKRGNIFLSFSKTGSKYESKTLIIASGRSQRKLGVKGEKDFEGKGVSYCSICDAPLFEGKNVAVIGAGKYLVEPINDLLNVAAKIYILEFGPRIVLKEEFLKKVQEKGNAEFITSASVVEIKGDKFVKSLVYKNRETKELNEIEVDGVFVSMGSQISTGYLKGFLDLNPNGEIVINHKTGETSVKGVFAAGDAVDNKFKQIIISAGQGATAALSAFHYLSGL